METAIAIAKHVDERLKKADNAAKRALSRFAETEERLFGVAAAFMASSRAADMTLSAAGIRQRRELMSRVEEVRAPLYEEAEEEMEEVAHDIAKDESDHWLWLWAALGVTATALSTKWLDRVAKYGVYNGLTRQQIYDKLRQADAERIFQAITETIQRGGDINAVIADLRNMSARSRRHLGVETEIIISGVAADAAIAFATEKGGLLRYSAVLDGKECAECAELDGKIFSPNDETLPHLPMHANCRCILIPLPANFTSIESASFADYFALLTPAQQRARLGMAKYEAWKRGEYALLEYEPFPA